VDSVRRGQSSFRERTNVTKTITDWLIDLGEKTFYSNIDWEQKVSEGVRFPQIKSRASERIVEQMDQHQLFIASETDHVIVREKPDPQFVQYLEKNNWTLPNLIVGDYKEKLSMKSKKVLVPYLVDKEDEEFLKPNTFIGPQAELALRLNNKVQMRQFLEEKGIRLTEGTICRSVEEIIETYRHYPGERLVIKLPFGSSGKGLFHIRQQKELDYFIKFLNRRGIKEFEVSVEKWHDTQMSLNAQLLLWEGTVHILAITEQKVDSSGVYRGSDLTPNLSPGLLQNYHDLLKQVGTLLLEEGYQGVLGIDSIVETDGEIIPVIEVNARLTLVTYSLPLLKRFKSEGHQKVFSCFFDYKRNSPHTFDEVIHDLNKNINPTHNRGFFVYGFHKYEVEGESYTYRLFFILYGESISDIEEMQDRIDSCLREEL
jgi:ATP-grasp domain